VIKKLSVKNFKSIKELEIDCRRINLFIGEPNTGKSNILEALGLLSWCGHGKDMPLKEYVRFQETQNLFCDNWFGNSVEMKIVKAVTDTRAEETAMRIGFEEEKFNLDISHKDFRYKLGLDYAGDLLDARDFPVPPIEFIKYYTFKRQDNFQGRKPSFLMPPHGSNMFAVVMGNRKLRASMARFFNDLGFKLVLRPQARTFESQKQIEDEDIDVAFGYPYISTSDTLQRMIFYTIAIESNENSTLVFEEPESHAFPSQTYQLGEKIASDERNQYFIATHNPYLFLSILERAPKDDVNVFITYFEDYQTKVKCLNDEGKSKIMVYDPFANLDYFIGTLDSLIEEEEG
jgi:AAA15 family ATPase/GTPase